MPFLSREEFKEWADDGTGNVWQRVNATGAFCGLCYAAGDILRNLRVLRGASSMKYRIITDFTDAENRHIHIEVAQADSEEDFLDLLNRLNSLTVQEVMGAASSDRMEMLEQLIERARNIDVDVANEHKEFLSGEMLQKISRLERAETSLQQKLEEAQKALQHKEAEKQELQDELRFAKRVEDSLHQELEEARKALRNTEAEKQELQDELRFAKRVEDSLHQELEEARKAVRNTEAETQELQDEFCAAMAQQALERVSDLVKGAAESSNATESTENRPDSLGQSSGVSSTSNDASSSEARNEREVATLPDIEAGALDVNCRNSEDIMPFLLPQGRISTGDETEMQTAELRQSGMSFVQRVLHGPFRLSLARAFWQLAAAPYGAISCNHVELEGKVWEVIAHNRATETLVIGRRVEKTDIFEVGFRGTVTADVHGNGSAANWSSNLDYAAVPLQGPDGDDSDVLVHKGFLPHVAFQFQTGDPSKRLITKSLKRFRSHSVDKLI